MTSKVDGGTVDQEKFKRLISSGGGNTLDTLIADFEILEPPKRIANLKGEKIDLSFIPAIVSLKFIAFSKKHDVNKLEAMTGDDFDETIIDDILEIVASICEGSNPKVTKKWLFENLTLEDLLKFIHFVFEGIINLKNGDGSGGSGGGDTKN